MLRISRLLRPLRSIRNLEALTVLSNALLNAAYPLLVTTCIILMTITLIALMSMQLLRGRMVTCTDPHVQGREDCTGWRSDGSPRRWIPATFSFDWIGAGLLSSLVFALNEGGWVELLHDTADARGLHDGPWQWSNTGVVIIGLFAVVIVGFLLMKIYTAIFVQFYADALLEREKQGSKDSELSNHALATKIRRRNLPALMDDERLAFKHKVKDLLEHPTVEGLVTLCVVINLGMMGAESYKRTQAQTDVEKISEYFFSWLFGIEVTLKIWCMTTSMFRYNRFNMLEWCVSSLSAISLFIPCMYALTYGTI